MVHIQQKKSVDVAQKTEAGEKNKEDKVEECCCADKKTCGECEEMKQQVEEYKSKYLRALADYQNHERHVQNQRMELVVLANKELVSKLLPFLDDLNRAEVFIQDKNLVHIKNSFMKILEDEGLKEIEVMGKEYDPYTAEVIDMVPGEKDGFVVEVLRKGYMFNEKIIRIAQVKVSKKV